MAISRYCSALFITFAFVFLSLFTDAYTQERPLKLHTYSAFLAGVDELPFWHYANTRGKVHPGSQFNSINGISLEMPFRDTGSRFNYSLGGELFTRISDTGNTVHFQQLFGKIEYGIIRLSAGRFDETFAMNRSELSTGSMMVSENATPIPRISLEVNRFTDVPLTRGRFQFKGYYSEGILESDRFTSSARVHQKAFYLKLIIENFEGIGGIVHNVMYSGTNEIHDGLSPSFNDYLRVVFSQPASIESGLPGTGNRLGNSIGAYDFTARYSLDNYRISAYRLFYLEDTPSRNFRSPWDGVWGLGIDRESGHGAVTGILYQHINTITQDAKNQVPDGRANYYNHAVYRSGWSYRGSAIGNPLLTFDPEENRFVNNMIIGHHIGISGTPSRQFTYRVLATYTRNYGTCNDRIATGRCTSIESESIPPEEFELRSRSEFRQDQYSTLFEVSYQFSEKKGIRLNCSLAFDTGTFLGNRTGLMIGISWSGK